MERGKGRLCSVRGYPHGLDPELPITIVAEPNEAAQRVNA